MKKKLAVFLTVLPILFFIVIYIYFAYNPSKALNRREQTSEADVTVTEVTLPVPTAIDGQYALEDATDSDGKPLIVSQQLYMLMPVKHISQNPELPTGCEITSLTMVLNYLGFDVSKTYMAEHYLDKLETFDGSFYDYFIGDPAKTESWGCFAPAITNAANRYLSKQNSALKAYNISSSSLQSLFNELSAGHPVIVWTTSDWDEKTTYTSIRLNDNSVFNWPSNEHCVVLIGFNLEKGTVFLADPLSDVIEKDLSAFAKSYDAYYKQAVVIK